MTVPVDVFQQMPARDYEEIRDELRSGDIVLFSGPALMSHLIEWATRCPWSHVGFILRLDEIDRILVLEAVPAGARTVALSSFVLGNSSLSPYKGKLLVARHADFPSEPSAPELKAMSEFAIDRFGAPYANLELFWIAARIVLGWFNFKMPALMKPEKAFICSEYAARCFQEVGIEIAWDGLGFIAPADFANDPKVTAHCVVKTAG